MPNFVSDAELYQEIFEKEPSAIIILDERGVVCKVNQSALDMLGVESLIGRKWYQVIGEVFRPRGSSRSSSFPLK